MGGSNLSLSMAVNVLPSVCLLNKTFMIRAATSLRLMIPPMLESSVKIPLPVPGGGIKPPGRKMVYAMPLSLTASSATPFASKTGFKIESVCKFAIEMQHTLKKKRHSQQKETH